MQLDLVYWPHPVLRQKAAPVLPEEFGEELERYAEAMIRVMHESNGIGLAAPQVARGKRMLVVTPSTKGGDEIVVCNPRILDQHGEQIGDEGCLSFPGITGKVRRAEQVTVECQDARGNKVVHDAEGLFSRCLQHEIDHLDGVLFIRKMSPAGKIRAKRKLKELENKWAPIYEAAAKRSQKEPQRAGV